MLAGQLVISEDSTKAFSCFIELWPFFFKMCLLLPCTKTLQVLLRVENSVCGLASFLACLDFISKLRPDLQNRVHMAGGSHPIPFLANASIFSSWCRTLLQPEILGDDSRCWSSRRAAAIVLLGRVAAFTLAEFLSFCLSF